MPAERISVVIPVFNGARYLAEAIESALAQTFPVHELIVVDDGSSDESAQVAERLTQGFHHGDTETTEVSESLGATPLTVLRQAHAGVSSARNAGVAHTTGDYLAFLDADDTWEPSKLARQLATLRDAPAAGLVLCAHNYRFEGPIPAWFHGPRDGSPGAAQLMVSSLIRRATWERVGPFSTGMTHGEDGDWLMRALDMGVQSVAIDEPLWTYRIHESNASGQAAGVRDGLLRALRASVHRKHGGES